MSSISKLRIKSIHIIPEAVTALAIVVALRLNYGCYKENLFVNVLVTCLGEKCFDGFHFSEEVVLTRVDVNIDVVSVVVETFDQSSNLTRSSTV